MSVKAIEYAIVKADQAAQLGGNTFKTLDRSLTIITLGTLTYGFCILYSVVSDLGNKVADLMEPVTDILTGVPVPEEIFSDEGFAILEAEFQGRGWVDYRLFLMSYDKAKAAWIRNAGFVRVLPMGADELAGWQRIILKARPGFISSDRAVKFHPVDRVVGIIMKNHRTYFGIVGGLALLPAVPAVGSILRGSFRRREAEQDAVY